MKQKRSQSFVEGKGFYIALLLCVAAIGISGYYLFNGLTRSPEGFGGTAAVSGQAEVPREDPAPTVTVTPEKEPAGETAAETETTPDQPEPQPQPTADPDAEAASYPAYVWPVEGAVDRDFSLEVFAYDDTMGDWRTHDGLDIAAEVGAPVSACGRGTVTEVTEDPFLGVMVTVDHGRGMVSRYANLAEGVKVRAGDAVEPGTVLGEVGTTAISESASPSHLHFEMIEYDHPIDPLNYLH